MQIPRDHIILGLVALTLVFLLAGGFLLLYIALYNARKKRHLQEKQQRELQFEQELTKSKMEVQEQTLTTIGRDIHDNIGQILSVAKLTLGSVRSSDSEEKVRNKLANAFSLVDIAIRESRHLAQILHPGGALSQGLVKAIEAELDWIAKLGRFEVKFSLTGHGDEKLGNDRELIAFRIVQEALNNAIKHADASAIFVSVLYNDLQVEICVRDNGKGFDYIAGQQNGSGLGLQSFFERAKLIKAELHIDSSPGAGTGICLTVPYNP
ncbi:MAG: sensor histidine kinase [Bacteroidetes bacterium]|nr:sensor histidine kinase [Bacteroidota bacterium]